MPSISLPTIALASAGAGLVGSALSASAAGTAAKDQTNAETNAANIMHQQYLQTRSDLLPYNTQGQTDISAYNAMAPFSFNPTQATLENLPGYQFTQDQGLKAVQNSAASRGLGVSGAAQKGAASYATGLAAQTWPELYNANLQTYQTNANKLLQGATLGENAAAQTGAFGTQTAANIGQTAVGIGNAQAAGAVGTANAISGGLNGIGGNLFTAALLGGQGGLFGGRTGGSSYSGFGSE